MIKNERQYQITKAQAQKFEQALADLASYAEDKNQENSIFFKAQQSALESQLADLREELEEYEARIVEEDPIPCNLPTPTYTAFIGRDAEKKRLLELLSPNHASNIITVDGIGGVGKTALVIEVARQCLAASQENLTDAPHFDIIVYTSAKQQYLLPSGLVPRPQTHRNLRNIVEEIGRTLRRDDTISETAPEEQFNRARQSLSRGQQRTLLIVDNLETMEDKADILGFLYDLPSTVKSIITTREQGVIHVPIRLLSLSDKDSIRLIQQQTQEKQINLTESEQLDLYRSTSGIPLVIIYAIGRLANSGSLETVLTELISPTGDVAQFLFTQSVNEIREKPAYKLLMALAIFQDTPVRDAITTVAGFQTTPRSIVDEGLERLQQLSLISQMEDRYSMLYLTREYALAELANNENFETEARDRWIQWYLEFSRKNGGVDWGRGQSGYSRLQKEWGNLILVLEYCAACNRYDDVKNIWQLLNELAYGYGYWRESIDWLQWLIQESQSRGDWETFVDIAAKASWAYMRWYSPENLEIARDLLTRAWALRDHAGPIGQDFVAHNLAQLYILREEYNESRTWLDEQERIINGFAEEDSYQIRRLMTVKYSRAEILFIERSYDQAKDLFQEVCQRAQEIGWQRYSNYAQNWLADICIIQNDLERAEKLLNEGLIIAERNNFKRRIFCYKLSCARLEQKKGNLTNSRNFGSNALEGFEQLGMEREAKETRSFLDSLNLAPVSRSSKDETKKTMNQSFEAHY